MKIDGTIAVNDDDVLRKKAVSDGAMQTTVSENIKKFRFTIGTSQIGKTSWNKNDVR